MGMGAESSWMFDLGGTVIPIFLVVMLGIVTISVGKGLLQWSRNNNSPLLTLSARIVSKRSEITQKQDEGVSSRTTTTHYLTFEVSGGDRMEFIVSGHEYGMSVEGDTGSLTFQGTRYYGFQRQPHYSTSDGNSV